MTIYEALKDRVLLLDGAFGTLMQRFGFSEEDFRGETFHNHPFNLKGCYDVLCITRPYAVRQIHDAYLAAGADIIETNSFNANSLSLTEYGLQDKVYDIARAAASVARAAADAASTPDKPRFVAGSMGPTKFTASISSDVDSPAARDVTFDTLEEAYHTQASGLIDGGADILLIETVFDTLNAKAALHAIERLRKECGKEIPVMVSVTISDASARTLSGQTIDAFYTSIAHSELLSVGMNCSLGAHQMYPFVKRLAECAPVRISVHPNAGLPNLLGEYDQSAEQFASEMEQYLKNGLVNIVGGCCGTTPDFIKALAEITPKFAPREIPEKQHITTLSGLESLKVVAESNFVNIGERTNVAGSAKFARLIRENNFEEALSVARAQVDSGAQAVDVCMDDGLIDGVYAMTQFLNMMASDPEIARVPVMIDSSDWKVLEAGLKCTQGKSIVNSISLKEGEKVFLERAAAIHSYGAAAVVMLFDEKGQATTYERKIEVAGRCYKLLTDNGFPPEDIIFDPNILAVATGMSEHDGYAKAYIDAAAWIKANCPYAKISGGVSNLSFSFRGNNTVREAMHSVFLYHAGKAGMDMGIVNPQMLKIYTDIDPVLLEKVEDVILCRKPDAATSLIEYAEVLKNQGAAVNETAAVEWLSWPVADRIKYAMVKGIADNIEADSIEAYHLEGSAIKVIDNILMPAMETVGQLFSEGKMFLPQVVKTARVMKKAVAAVTPFLETSSQEGKFGAKILIATVKGDVHDIGKNIVGVVLACNGYDVIDLGVMVEPELIVKKALEINPDIIGLSGLITPSLNEMAKVCEALEDAGVNIPVIVGGATTSDVHTALKIAPSYSGAVIRGANASDSARIVASIISPARDKYISEIRATQESLRVNYLSMKDSRTLIPYREALSVAKKKDVREAVAPHSPIIKSYKNYPLEDVINYIDWDMFYAAWQVQKADAQKESLHKDAVAMLAKLKQYTNLQAVVGVYHAYGRGDDIVLDLGNGDSTSLAMLRNQTAGAANVSLADFVSEAGEDVTLFALTSGVGTDNFIAECRQKGDEYEAIMAKLLADRLAEAFAGALFPSPKGGCRAAFGYPTCPDHSLKKDVFRLLDAEEVTDMHLTENYMIVPGESICGIIISQGEFFNVGKVSDDQLSDYAARRKMNIEEIKRLIPKNL